MKITQTRFDVSMQYYLEFHQCQTQESLYQPMEKENTLVIISLFIGRGVHSSLKEICLGCQKSTGHQRGGTFMGPFISHSSHNILGRQPWEPVTQNPHDSKAFYLPWEQLQSRSLNELNAFIPSICLNVFKTRTFQNMKKAVMLKFKITFISHRKCLSHQRKKKLFLCPSESTGMVVIPSVNWL